MKMISSVLKFIIILLAIVISQDNAVNGQIKIGFKSGISSSRFLMSSTPAYNEMNNKIGFLIAGIFDYDINNYLGIRVEPGYYQKGYDLKYNGSSINPSIPQGSICVNYLELPISIVGNYNFAPLYPYLTAGFSIGYLVNAKSVATVNGNEKFYEIKDSYKDLDLSLALGAGSEYSITTTTTIIFDIKYLFGISDISRNSLSRKTRNFLFTIGLLFEI
jgi:opacity protein-like surface antigen